MSVLIVPRWGGAPTADWIPWLTDQLDETIVCAPLRPVPEAPTIDACVAEVEGLLVDPAHTVLVGHSVGCQVLLRTLARADDDVRVPAMVCVAGWFRVDQPWPEIRPWLETPLDDAAVRRGCGHIELLVSDDDPFTSDHRATATAFKERLDATVTVVHRGQHFNGAEEPVVLDAVRRALGRRP